MSGTPPRFAERLVAWVVRDRHAAAMVTTDLRADYARVERRFTQVGAHVWYWFAAAGTIWWYARDRWRQRRAAPEPVRREGALRSVFREARFVGRIVRRAPAFTGVTVLTLGLAVGAATAIFAVVDGVILKPLSYPDEQDLVRVTHRSNRSSERLGATDAHYFHYRAESSTLADLALYIESSAPADGDDGPIEVGVITTTPSLFSILQVRPLLGRLFTEEDAAPGEPDKAILSHAYWMRRFGGDSSVIGRPLSDRLPIPIVGVLPESFEFVRPRALSTYGNAFGPPDIFVPLTLIRSRARFGNFMFQAIGRLAPGATPETAERELIRLLEPMPEAFPGGLTRQMYEEGQYRAVVEPLRTALVGNVAGVLWIIAGAVGVVLVIASVNVLNLFLVRAEGRRRDVAVRRALGATTGQVATSLLVESVLLCTAGGALGVGLAGATLPWLVRLAPGSVPRLAEVGLDHRVLLVAAGLSGVIGVVLGLVTLTRFFRNDAVNPGAERSATASRHAHRLRHALVAGQVTFALMLLIGAGLLVRTFINLRNVDPGFGASNVLTVRVTVGGNFPNPQDKTDYLLDLTRRLAELPGVESATFAGDLPLDENVYSAQFAKADALPEPGTLPPTAVRSFVGPGFFRAIGASLERGRELTRLDYETDPDGVVVNRAFADQWWPGEDPIGKRTVQWPANPDTWYRVIGVVADIREAHLAEPATPTVYLPTVFRPGTTYGMSVSNFPLVIRTAGDPHAIFDAVREEIDRTGSLVPVTGIQTLDDLQAASMQQLSLAMVLLVMAGGAALILGIVGVYGVVAYIVTQRTREIGVRVALGARPTDIRTLVLRQGALVGLIGAGIGVGGAALLSRVLQSLLFGVTGTDAVTYGALTATLLGAVLLASLVPARRAAALDPVAALNTE